MTGRSLEIGFELAGHAPAIDFGLHALQCSARRPEVSSGGTAWQNEWVSKKKKQAPKRKTRVKKERRAVALKRSGATRKNDEIFGFMAGKFEIVGDIESPIEDWEYWDPAKNLED
jgi:hypothetical protein